MNVSRFITNLEPGDVFTFGSNLAGRHSAGAALIARKRFGAVYGIGVGPQGQCYAIPTKDKRLNVLPLTVIGEFVSDFLMHAKHHPKQKFLVTAIGCGLAGYEPSQIAPLFFKYPIPKNVLLPQVFLDQK